MYIFSIFIKNSPLVPWWNNANIRRNRQVLLSISPENSQFVPHCFISNNWIASNGRRHNLEILRAAHQEMKNSHCTCGTRNRELERRIKSRTEKKCIAILIKSTVLNIMSPSQLSYSVQPTTLLPIMPPIRPNIKMTHVAMALKRKREKKERWIWRKEADY